MIIRVRCVKGRIKNGLKNALFGVFIGIVNGALGAGGGMLAVPALRRAGVKGNAAHPNAVAVILPITAVSVALYALKGNLDFRAGLAYIPAGLVGSVLGTVIIKKIPPLWLKRIFGGFMVYAGVRLLLR